MNGRDLEPCELALEFRSREGRWVSRGDGSLEPRTAAEQEVYELLQETGEADAGTLAREVGKTRVAVHRTLKRLEEKGHIESMEVPAALRRGKRIVYHVPGQDDTEIGERR